MFVVSSQWAAKWLVINNKKIGFKNFDSVVCLSEKQKQICSKFSENIIVAEQQNSFSLAQSIKESNHGETIIYLHGNLSLKAFDRTLESFVAGYEKLEVYRNLPILKKIDSTFDVYIFFSPSGVENFASSGNRIPETSFIVAIGTTTAETCGRFFNREIHISKKQEELAAVQFAAGLIQNRKQVLNHIN